MSELCNLNIFILRAHLGSTLTRWCEHVALPPIQSYHEIDGKHTCAAGEELFQKRREIGLPITDCP